MTHNHSELKSMARQEVVDVTYSIVKQEALGTQAQNPGALPHGQDARENMGVSVVRENREIIVDNAFVREGGRGSIPMNRWWGCEVRFGRGCDDLFGIDHNKQMVVKFSNAARELLNSEEDSPDLLRNLGEENNPIYKIVAEIRNTTKNLAGDINLMFERRKKERQGFEGDEGPQSPEDEAMRLATVSTNDKLDEQSEAQTQTDRDHKEKDSETRQEEIQNFLASEGYEDEEASSRAAELVRNAFRYSFTRADIDGFQMFSVRNAGGILFVNLNINHQLYEFLRIIEEDALENDNPVAYKAAVGIRTLLLAWARMEDHIEAPERKQRVQQIAAQWGEHASDVLGQLNQQDG